MMAGPTRYVAELALEFTALAVLERTGTPYTEVCVWPGPSSTCWAARRSGRGSGPSPSRAGTLQVLLQSRRIKVAAAETLVNFRTKVPAPATDTLEAWREGVHDDLVLAVASAAWVGERGLRRLCAFV